MVLARALPTTTALGTSLNGRSLNSSPLTVDISSQTSTPPTAPTTPNDELYRRQREIFDPAAHRDVLGDIALVGCGAIGSAVAITLAKMGIRDRLYLYDPDDVEPHNVANQLAFSRSDAGATKVSATPDAAASLVYGYIGAGGLDFVQYPQLFPIGDVESYTTIIVATDNLESRREIFDYARNPRVRMPKYWLDLRIGQQQACRYALKRNRRGNFPRQHVTGYRRLLQDGDDDPCGARSFLPTALLAASLAGITLAAWGRGEDVPWSLDLTFDVATRPRMFVEG